MPHITLFISTYIKLFFLLTPFFVLTMFLAFTRDMSPQKQRGTAIRVALAVIITCLILYYFGNIIFKLFGITLDAFRIGAGSLLFLSAVDLVRGTKKAVQIDEEDDGDISVVPLAIPITVGPATVGAMLIMGATAQGPIEHIIGSAALIAAVTTVGTMLFLASHLEKILGKLGLTILTKITGLILSALSAQIVFTGIKGFLG